MARLSTRNLAIGAARTLGAGVWRITPLTTRALVAGVMRFPFKYRIAVVIIFAGAAIGISLTQGRGESSAMHSAMHSACNGFRQWQRSHNLATLISTTNNLDHRVSAQGGGRLNQTQLDALTLDTDIGNVDLIVQYHLPWSLSADTHKVVDDCRGI